MVMALPVPTVSCSSVFPAAGVEAEVTVTGWPLWFDTVPNAAVIPVSAALAHASVTASGQPTGDAGPDAAGDPLAVPDDDEDAALPQAARVRARNPVTIRAVGRVLFTGSPWRVLVEACEDV
jgi:hypothetical protein